MPRVVQVPSSDTEEVNVYNADSSESEDTVNRNFNQTINFMPEPLTYMRFPINYSLYNVTYLESENDPYCLRCEINGQVKKFKKDARTWLHKSSERKRKFCDEMIRNVHNEENASACKNLKLVSDAQQIIAYGGTYRSGPYNTDINNDLLSDLSSLGDSDADLTYSEESSPSLVNEMRDKYLQKSVRFDDTVHTGYRVHSISSDSDESISNVEKTTSSRNIVFEDESEGETGNNVGSGNESRNNIRRGPKLPQINAPRFAPGIDNAVNFSTEPRPGITAPYTQYDTKDKGPASMRKMRCQKNKPENRTPYNLRSKVRLGSLVWASDGRSWVTRLSVLHPIPMKRNDMTMNSRQRSDVNSAHIVITTAIVEPVESSPKRCSQESSRLDCADVKPAVACMDLAHPREVVGTDQMPSCSRGSEDIPEGAGNDSVPTLFVLAGRALYKHFKSELNIIH